MAVEVRNTFRFIRMLLVMNLKSAMEYRVAFIGQALFMVLNNLIFLVFWWLFFQRFQAVEGWKIGDVLGLYSIAAFGFGVAMVLCGNATKLAGIITSGGVDAYLALPKDPLLHILMSRMSAASFGDAVFGLCLFLTFTENSLQHLPAFLLAGICAGVIFASFAVCAHSLAFFFGSAEGVGRLLHEALLTLSLYPESLFSGRVQLLLYTLIPAGFLTHLPVRFVRDPSLQGLLLLALAAILWALIATAVFRAGLRRYESGSLIQPRL